MTDRIRKKALVTATVISLLGMPCVKAATYTWNGGGTDRNMTTDANWVSGSAPSPATDLDLVFGATSSRYNPIADTEAPWIVHDLTIETQTYSFSGNQIQFAGDSPTMSAFGTGHGFGWSNPVDLASAFTFDMHFPYNFTFGGAITGDGSFTSTAGSGTGGSTVLHFAAVNTYTGATNLYGKYLSVDSTNGQILNSAAINSYAGGILSLASGGPGNRIGDSVPIYLQGGGISNNNADETLGTTTLQQAYSSITAANGTILRLSDVVRANNACAVAIGATLGATGGSRIFVNNAGSAGHDVMDDLIGGGGAAGTTTLSVLPYMIGGLASNNPTFLTYTIADGFRPLDVATEYVINPADWSTLSVNDNVILNVAGTKTLTANAELNALRLGEGVGSPGGIALTGSVTLKVDSGAILYASNTHSLTLSTSALDFNGKEGVFTFISTGGYAGSVTISSVIQNANGFTFNASGAASNIYLSGANTYSGPTTINAHTLRLNGGDDRLPVGTTVFVARGATLNLNGRNQTIRGVEGVGTVTNSSGTRNLTVNATGAGDAFVFDGLMSGGINLIKSGPGSLALTGNNTYTGTTAINDGTLIVSGLTTGTGTFTVGSAGTLAGNGTITADVVNDGAVTPGTSVGTLTVDGNFTNNGQLVIELTAEDNDQLIVTGDATMGGTLWVDLVTPFRPLRGTTFEILSTGGTLIDDGIAVAGPMASLFTVSVDEIGGVVILTSQIPEPGTLALLGLGLLALRRRR